MLEEKPEYKKRKKYTKRRQQVIRQLFFMGVAVVGVIIGFFFRKVPHKFNDAILGFAAGIMLSD